MTPSHTAYAIWTGIWTELIYGSQCAHEDNRYLREGAGQREWTFRTARVRPCGLLLRHRTDTAREKRGVSTVRIWRARAGGPTYKEVALLAEDHFNISVVPKLLLTTLEQNHSRGRSIRESLHDLRPVLG